MPHKPYLHLFRDIRTHEMPKARPEDAYYDRFKAAMVREGIILTDIAREDRVTLANAFYAFSRKTAQDTQITAYGRYGTGGNIQLIEPSQRIQRRIERFYSPAARDLEDSLPKTLRLKLEARGYAAAENALRTNDPSYPELAIAANVLTFLSRDGLQDASQLFGDLLVIYGMQLRQNMYDAAPATGTVA